MQSCDKAAIDDNSLSLYATGLPPRRQPAGSRCLGGWTDRALDPRAQRYTGGTAGLQMPDSAPKAWLSAVHLHGISNLKSNSSERVPNETPNRTGIATDQHDLMDQRRINVDISTCHPCHITTRWLLGGCMMRTADAGPEIGDLRSIRARQGRCRRGGDSGRPGPGARRCDVPATPSRAATSSLQGRRRKRAVSSSAPSELWPSRRVV